MIDEKTDKTYLFLKTLLVLFMGIFITIFIVFFIGVSRVDAKTYRIRMFNPSSTQVLDVRNQNGSYNGKMIRSLVNAWDASLPANKVTYFNIQNTQAINICTEYGILSNTVACTVRADYMKYYYYDANGNTYEITDSCQSAITKNTIIYNANNTTTYQYKINTACSFTPTVAVAGFQQEILWVYNLAAQQGSGSSAIVVGNFTITQDATEGDQIMQNATENANRIIANQNQNTDAILGGIEDLKGDVDAVVTGLDDLNDTLNDSSVSSDVGTSFFNGFSDTDHGGLSGIVTAPLNSINAMLSNTCTPISGTVYNKTFEIPCGTEMWSRLGVLKDFLNLTLGGLIVYNICRSLYLKIHNLKKPDDDRIEVMEL